MARKLIGFDLETLRALELLSSDSGKSLQQLADGRSATCWRSTIGLARL